MTQVIKLFKAAPIANPVKPFSEIGHSKTLDLFFLNKFNVVPNIPLGHLCLLQRKLILYLAKNLIGF